MNDMRSDQSRGDSRSAPGPLLQAAQFGRVRDALAVYSGVYIDNGRLRLLEHGIAQRLAVTGLAVDAYLRLFDTSESRRELHALTELVLNHETMFFRNMIHMRALQEEVFPALHRQKPPGEPLRIWSAGCATGEEPYSLAIIAAETFGRVSTRPVEIIGTDLSEAALAKAQAGRYRGRSLANLSPARQARFFTKHGSDLAVNDTLRDLVRFERLNLLDPFPSWTRGVDLIFCQNVTIYFQVATCRSLMAQFHAALPEGGLLFLGFSETIWHIFNEFLVREIAGGFVYYKESSNRNLRSDADRSQRAGLVDTGSRKGTPARIAATPRTVTDRRRQPGTIASPTDKEDGATLLARSRALLQHGDVERALDLLRRLPPDSDLTPEALLLIARVHADRNDLDLALAEVQRALELDRLNIEGNLLLGLLYSRQEQWRAASDQLERARYLDAVSPLPSFYLAEAYRQDGRLGAAVREYRNVIQKLGARPPGTLLDGVAVGWIRETCQRYMQQLTAIE